MSYLLARVLAIVALAWVFWRLYRRWMQSTPVARDRREDSFEPMARCAQCGVHLPRAKLSSDGRCGRCGG